MSARRRAVRAAVVLALGLAVLVAVSLRWTADDAFISFRYAQNLVRGHGLVYNPGERVEGYTNFLWTVVVAGGMWLGLDPVPFAQTLTILCYAGLLALFVAASGRLARESERDPLFPITAVSLAAIYHLQAFATGGLETMPFTLLVSTGYVGLVFARSPRDHALSGVALTLAMMNRPDGALFYVAALGVTALYARGERSLRSMVALALPALVLYAPYYALRYAYYGWPFPNTFYTKSGGGTHYEQGLVYVRFFFRAYRALLLAPAALALFFLAATRFVPARARAWLERPDPVSVRAALLCAAAIPLYVAYVVRVGGDFMFGRFLVPVTPLLCLALELFARRLTRPAARWAFAAAVPALLLAGSLGYWRHRDEYGHGIAEERDGYPGAVAQARERGAVLERHLRGTNAQVLFHGTQAMLAYYAEFPVAIDGYGLTDEYVGHLPVSKRGRPGHEKHAPLDYLWRRGVNFAFASALMKMPPAEAYRHIDVEGIDGRIIVYDRALMDRLAAGGGVEFVRFESYLDEYLRGIAALPTEKVREDYEAFRHFYFDRNPDPAREQRFKDRL